MTPATGPGEQLTLSRTRTRSPRVAAPVPAADVDPVARVAVAVSLPHLDRLFDYEVPATMAEAAVPGARVRVRFAGRLVDGFVLERRATSDHAGALQRLNRVISPVPVLTPDIAALARAVADRYAGTLADVLRAAIPPRHARAERAVLGTAEPADPPLVDGTPADVPPVDGVPRSAEQPSDGEPPVVAEPVEDPGAWADYVGGPALVSRAVDRARPGPRAVWTALPGDGWPVAIADLVGPVARAGAGALVVVPDFRDVDRVASAIRGWAAPQRGVGLGAESRAGAVVESGSDPAASRPTLPAGSVVTLTADLGPERRYRTFLQVLRGSARVVVGTRAAAFAPVRDLRLLVVWDDGDDLHAEPHAPYWHSREVAVLRAHQTGAALVLGGHARTPEAEGLVATGWARSVAPRRPLIRERGPRVLATGDDVELARDAAAATARLPHLAWVTAREGLTTGPVLVQVPRRGYVPSTACRRCRTAARCPACAGPLTLTSGHAIPSCSWCGRLAGDWSCPECGSVHLRAITIGSDRTAEELGRAFPGVPVVVAGGDHVVPAVDDRPALVVSTPGAEPAAAGGYSAVLLLDARAQLERPGLRSAEEALRRWFAAAALARPRATVVVTADNALPAVQALVRWDPAWYAARELAERESLGLPPATRAVSLIGSRAAVEDLAGLTRAPEGTRVLGPVPVGDPVEARVRTLLVAPRASGVALSLAVRQAAGVRSAKRADPVEVRVDPLDLG